MITVAFFISVDPAWLGGINYFRNLITAIYEDPDRTIDVVLLTGLEGGESQFKGFPPVRIIRDAMFDPKSQRAWWRRQVWRVARRDLMLDRLLMHNQVDVLSHSGVLGRGARTPVINWIPDFQHLRLPALFSSQERAERNRWYEVQCRQSKVVVLSSETAQGDLAQLFPWAHSRSQVLRFAPQIEALERLPSLSDIEKRHGFSGPYIYLPNQYWAHKNHAIVVEALALLKQSGHDVKVISTGSPSDYRNPDFYKDFCRKVTELGLDDNYLRLGVVPYLDLLALMSNSVCMINPSLFEGWSTTVEEAKALGKHIVLSDIPVHREQHPERSSYFSVGDAVALSELLLAQWQRCLNAVDLSVDQDAIQSMHRSRRVQFSRKYHEIVSLVV